MREMAIANAEVQTSGWRERVSGALDVPMSLLAVATVALLVAELAFDLPDPWSSRVLRAQMTIWVIFVAEFVFQLAIARSRVRYLRENWLTALAVALPALRAFRLLRALRVLRASRALRSLNLARIATALNRARNALGDIAGNNQFGYVAALTLLVTIVAAAGAYFFERASGGEEGITSFPEALWWAATVVSTINAQSEPATLEGRLIALALRVFGVAIIGYITAAIAVYLIGRPAPADTAGDASATDELRALRDEVRTIRRLLEERDDSARGVTRVETRQ